MRQRDTHFPDFIRYPLGADHLLKFETELFDPFGIEFERHFQLPDLLLNAGRGLQKLLLKGKRDGDPTRDMNLFLQELPYCAGKIGIFGNPEQL